MLWVTYIIQNSEEQAIVPQQLRENEYFVSNGGGDCTNSILKKEVCLKKVKTAKLICRCNPRVILFDGQCTG